MRVQGSQFDSSQPKTESSLSLLKVASETGSSPIVILEGLAFLAELKFYLGTGQRMQLVSFICSMRILRMALFARGVRLACA